MFLPTAPSTLHSLSAQLLHAALQRQDRILAEVVTPSPANTNPDLIKHRKFRDLKTVSVTYGPSKGWVREYTTDQPT
jgi:hypothetical protein